MSWSDVVPNFDTLPPAMQVWIKDNMQSLVAAAMQSAEQMSASQSDAAHNYGVSAAGTSYQLTGQNHFLAVQGGSQEVVGQEKQQLLSGGLTTLNTQHEYKQVDGIATKSIGHKDEFWSNFKMLSDNKFTVYFIKNNMLIFK